MDSRATRVGRRLRSFRLTDIPIDVRLKAAEAAINAEIRSGRADALSILVTAADIRRAAESPSRRTYVVSAAAWEKVMK